MKSKWRAEARDAYQRNGPKPAALRSLTRAVSDVTRAVPKTFTKLPGDTWLEQ